MPNACLRSLRSLSPFVGILTLFGLANCGSDARKKRDQHEPAAEGGAAGSSDSTVGGTSDAGGFSEVPPGGASVGGASACRELTTETTHESGAVDSDETWSGIHVLEQGVSITNGAVLTLEPCAVLKFQPGDRMIVSDGASLRAIGDAERPVTFTSDLRTPAAGDWIGIDIERGASRDVSLQHVIVEYAAGSIHAWPGATLELADVLVRQVSKSALTIDRTVTLARFERVVAEDSQSCLTIGINLVGAIGSFSCTGAADPTIGVSGGAVTKPATWRNLELPYKLLEADNFFEALVEIEPGVELQFEPKTHLAIDDGGALRALGTAAEHVVFQSSKPVPAAADWAGLKFYDTGSGNSLLRYTDIRHASPAVFLVGLNLPVEKVDFSDSECGVQPNSSTEAATAVPGSDNDLGADCQP